MAFKDAIVAVVRTDKRGEIHFELYSDSEQLNFKNVISLLVIDKPISSLDEFKRFYVFELRKIAITS